MTSDELLHLLRTATEAHVASALVNANIALPVETPADVLEIFDRMLSELINDRMLASEAVSETKIIWPPAFRFGTS